MLKRLLHAGLWAKRHLSGHYRVPELDYLQRFISEDAVCVDVGAHAGSWLFPLARLAKKGHTYGFEALPYYAQVLRLTAKLVGPANLTIVNCAVIESTKTQEKIIWKDASGRRLTGFTHLAGTSEDKVKSISIGTTTLDDYFSQEQGRIQFIKCDVEGAEMRVLRGAQKLLQRCRPVVYMELVDAYLSRYGHKIADAFEIFAKLDYQSFRFCEEMKVLPVNGPSDYSGNDVFFIPREYTDKI